MHRAPQLAPISSSRDTKSRRIHTIIVVAALIATICAIAAPRTSAQDLGEIARQERARKQNNPAPAGTHVYTNEDMQRQQILTPEDQSRFSATTQPAPVTPAKSASQLASELTPSAPQPTAKPVSFAANAYSSPSCGSCGMNLLRDSGSSVARVLRTRGPSSRRDHSLAQQSPVLVVSTVSDTTSARIRNVDDRSAARKNNSPVSTSRAKTNSAPLAQTSTRANIPAATATSANSVPAPASQLTTKTIPVATAQSVDAQTTAQIPAIQIAPQNSSKNAVQITVQNEVQNIAAPIPTTVPLDQLPLGDVARYYRAQKRQSARANAQIDPGPVNAPSAPAVAATIPTAMPLDQMSLGDIARYYRAKQREESEAIASQTSPISGLADQIQSISTAKISTPRKPSTSGRRSLAPSSSYPLMLNAIPLASPKPTPTSALRPNPSRSTPSANPAIARSTASRAPVAPKRSVGGNIAKIRITSGDTLWQLARKYLGTGTRWPELAALNPTIQNPKRLQVGTQLALGASSRP